MKVLFIGGTGNISASSSRLALSQNIELWHLNRGTQPCIDAINTIHCDINDEVKAALALKNHQWDCVVNWIAFTPSDTERDIRLFKDRTAQYIFISTASAYQSPPETPFITEDTPLSNPFWQYSRDKIACEALLQQQKQTFPWTIVRPSHTYSTVIPICIGGWEKYTTVDRIKKGLPIVVHGDGTSLWVVTHARDFALGLVGLIGLRSALGEAFHITSDEILTWNQIHQKIADVFNLEAKIVHVTSDTICKLDHNYTGTLMGDKSSSVIFDNRKIKAFVPSFKAEIGFAEGIKSTIDWFEADPARQKISPDSTRFIEKLLETTQG